MKFDFLSSRGHLELFARQWRYQDRVNQRLPGFVVCLRNLWGYVGAQWYQLGSDLIAEGDWNGSITSRAGLAPSIDESAG